MMKKPRNIGFTLVLLISTLILSSFQTGSKKTINEQELISKSNFINLQYPAEKIYLHLDRPSYFVGEDIWFKAYLFDSPIPKSNLYIELLNSEGEIIDRKINWAQHGLAYGDFYLDKSLPTGIYQIRAYTNWMRNFDESWFFRKDILVWNKRDKSVKPETTELKSQDVNLRFFPEGGVLAPGVKNRVAFKATDKTGKGIQVEGEILDDKGKSIVTFRSSYKGIGSFVFEPEARVLYQAKAVLAGIFELAVDLPRVQTNVAKLFVESVESENIEIEILKVNSTSSTTAKNRYYLVGQAHGQVLSRNEINLSETGKIQIDKKNLPTGIIKFTLFDERFIPQSERLVFVNHNDFVEVEITTGKAAFLTRENVVFDVKTTGKEGFPYLSNLSMSVFNSASSIETEQHGNNILTQFFLKSELRGEIEGPAWYFKDNNPETVRALDNLMLTHGYRYFEWEEILDDNLPEVKYQPEPSLQLKGKVSNWFTNRPAANTKVTMMSVKSLLTIYDEKTDSTGNFVFSDLFVNDTVVVSIQAGNEKERRKYWIELDNSTNNSPETTILPSNYRYQNGNRYTTSWYLSEINSDIKNRKWNLSDTILLGDVNIVSSKREISDGHSRPYLDADYVLDVSRQDNIYTDVFEMLETTSPYMRNFLMKNPTLYLDGIPASAEFVDLPPSWFDKVEAVNMAPQSGGFGPALYFYTNRGETQSKDFDGLGLKEGRIVGYSIIRKFYSPVYASREPEETENDFRNTLFWDPIVRTDSTGYAKVSFYNSDETGTMQVIVEGITADGKLCRGTTSYEVTR